MKTILLVIFVILGMTAYSQNYIYTVKWNDPIPVYNKDKSLKEFKDNYKERCFNNRSEAFDFYSKGNVLSKVFGTEITPGYICCFSVDSTVTSISTNKSKIIELKFNVGDTVYVYDSNKHKLVQNIVINYIMCIENGEVKDYEFTTSPFKPEHKYDINRISSKKVFSSKEEFINSLSK